jgi:hypothetical protein
MATRQQIAKLAERIEVLAARHPSNARQAIILWRTWEETHEEAEERTFRESPEMRGAGKKVVIEQVIVNPDRTQWPYKRATEKVSKG